MRLVDWILLFEIETIIDHRAIRKLLQNSNDSNKNYEILQEVALDDFETGKAIKLDKYGKWYIDQHGKTLRHAKVIFRTHSLQQQICKQYINHDPSKIQDKCIEVLLCKPQGLDKWIAISTLRKLETKCIKTHPLTYAIVPPTIFKKAVMKTEGISDDEKIALINYYQKVRNELIGMPEFQKKLEKLQDEKPIIVNSPKDIVKLAIAS